MTLSNTDAAAVLEHRRPWEEMERLVIQHSLRDPGDPDEAAVDALRYVLSFARLQTVRAKDGQDVEVGDSLSAHAWKVRERLAGPLKERTLWPAMRVLPELVALTRERRRRLLEQLPLDRESLDAEVCNRQLVVVLGGGGGAGYSYAGAWTLLHRRKLQPELIAGTSIGSLMGIFRARRRIFDGAPLVEASHRLAWDRVFRVLQMESRYGLPATLRLYLRAAIGSLFLSPEGQPLRFKDLEIPMLIMTTGIRLEGLQHGLDFYEHYLDDAVSKNFQRPRQRISTLMRLGSILKEFVEAEDALCEVVFGSDPATYDADIVDAAGFSSSIPGLIHYDVLRDDRHMKSLLDELYARYGITRLMEGGVVNNVPCRPAYAEAMSGRLGRRNPFVLALDCFQPRLRTPLAYGIQQLVRPNVLRNLPYATHYVGFEKMLSPLNLIPTLPELNQTIDWSIKELTPHMPLIEMYLKEVRPL